MVACYTRRKKNSDNQQCPDSPSGSMLVVAKVFDNHGGCGEMSLGHGPPAEITASAAEVMHRRSRSIC